MYGIGFAQQTTVFGKPKDWKDEDCYGLPVAQSVYGNSDGKDIPCLISYWEDELTDEQIAEIVRTRKIGAYLTITGAGMPPVSIQLTSPFPEGYLPSAGLQRFLDATVNQERESTQLRVGRLIHEFREKYGRAATRLHCHPNTLQEIWRGFPDVCEDIPKPASFRAFKYGKVDLVEESDFPEGEIHLTF